MHYLVTSNKCLKIDNPHYRPGSKYLLLIFGIFYLGNSRYLTSVSEESPWIATWTFLTLYTLKFFFDIKTCPFNTVSPKAVFKCQNYLILHSFRFFYLFQVSERCSCRKFYWENWDTRTSWASDSLFYMIWNVTFRAPIYQLRVRGLFQS